MKLFNDFKLSVYIDTRRHFENIELEFCFVVSDRNDGWMVAVNDKGEEGLVPGNFFEVFH